MRIFTVSDIHINYQENKLWLSNLSRQDYQEDILILPGDISHSLEDIAWAFSELKKRFNDVLYVPGNHDLWVKKSSQSSFERFVEINNLAKEHQVIITYQEYEKYIIVPILSWYDYSFGMPTQDLQKRWADFFRCDWENMNDLEVTQYFLQKNIFPIYKKDKKIITFSHFMPRIDIIFNGRSTKFLAPVLGSAKIQDIIQSQNSYIHIYGHSHINVFTKKNNIQYINNAFGYPHETHIASKELLLVV